MDSSAQLFPFDQLENVCFPFSLGPGMSRDEILSLLPPPNCCEYLVTEYFMRQCPLFHILHGPAFQAQYNTFMEDPHGVELSWLALLLSLCSMALHILEEDDDVVTAIWTRHGQPQPRDSSSLSYRLRMMAMVCLCQDDFLIRHQLHTLESPANSGLHHKSL